MKVVFRVDASVHIGSGHIMRCLVLAEELSSRGHSINFATRPQKGDFIEYIKSKGFPIIELVRPYVYSSPSSSSDYTSWLQIPWFEDAQDCISKIGKTDLLIIDHYGLNKDWEIYMENALNCKVMVIDDLVRPHKCSLMLDQTLGRKPISYKEQSVPGEILTGSNYALLANKYSDFRPTKKNEVTPDAFRILVTMGAIDSQNATLKILRGLEAIKSISFKVTVLLSQKSPHFDEVKSFCERHSSFRHIDFTDEMPKLMSRHNLSIGAPGSTSWERACLGLPTVIVPLADNQIYIAKKLVDYGAAIQLSYESISSDLEGVLKDMTSNWLIFHEKALQITDGKGTIRVADKIEKLFE
jgi:UDP-2,4-diacetamido-2,4,6-trideoxy-beta-L-altropyranose hydrolase